MAYGQDNINQYRKNAVNSASPLKLVVMLYDGCLRFINTARKSMLEGDIYSQNHNLQKAQNIVTELLSTLDADQGGDVAQNLTTLYNYVYDRLVHANINNDVEALDQAYKVMEDLGTAWSELERNGYSTEAITEETARAS